MHSLMKLLGSTSTEESSLLQKQGIFPSERYNGKRTCVFSEPQRSVHRQNMVESTLSGSGQPTWSYLYRHMVPEFLSYHSTTSNRYLRRRVLAPDFFGCGRSDKVGFKLFTLYMLYFCFVQPVDDEFYTWDMHHEFLINCESCQHGMGRLVLTTALSNSRSSSHRRRRSCTRQCNWRRSRCVRNQPYSALINGLSF